MKRMSIIWAGLLVLALVCSCNPGLPTTTLKFPDGKSSVEIPFTRYRGWIVIKATVNDTKALSFILDTGAPIAVLRNEGLASGLNLHIGGNVNLKGSDDNAPSSVPLADGVSFRVGELEIKGGVMAILATGDVIAGVDGVIGKYLFDEAVVTIDWKGNKIVLTKPDQFVYKGNGEILPIHLAKSGHIYTEVSVTKNGREKKLNAVIDSGKRSAFSLDQQASSTILTNEARLVNIYLGRGANGATYGDVTRTDVTLGSLHMDDVVTEIKGTPDVMEQGDLHGSIGLGMLDRFNLIFDHENQRLILEKNEHFTDKFPFNQSGIALDPVTAKEYVLIADIIPGSPAFEDGLLKEDRIISINGTRIPDLPINTIDDLIRGTQSDVIELEIQRGNDTYKKKLTMRPLI